jgi:hypothetical protein
MDDHEPWEDIRRDVREIRRMNVESRDFMPAVVSTLEGIGSALGAVGSALAAIEAEIRDLVAEGRAQREALLRVIDRMDRLDPGGSAA